MKQKPVIIFDLFGVIFSKGLESSTQELEAVFKKTKSEIAPVYRKWELEFDLARVNEFQFWSQINSELSTDADPRILSEIVLSGYRINADALKLADRLRKAFTLVTFSNYRREWFDKLDTFFGVSKYFSQIFISSEVGLMKPDPQVFSYISAKTGAPPSSLFLIDDEFENVKKARQVGCHAFLFENVFDTEIEIQRALGSAGLAYDEYYSGIILVTRQRAIILQRRDNLPSIANPGMLSTFGGRRESHEDAIQCALREIAEEASLAFTKEKLKFFAEVSCPIEDDKWMHCSFFLGKIDDVSTLDLKEGQYIETWGACDVLNQPDLTPVTKTILTKLCKSHGRLLS